MTVKTSSMKVMVLGLRGFPDVQGGIETHAEHLYPHLVEKGCEVHVIVRSAYMQDGPDTWKGIRFHRIWSPKTKRLEALVHTFLGVVYAAIKRPDILHVHAIGPALMVPLARVFGLRVIITHHGPDYDREKWGGLSKLILRFGESLGMRYASQRIVISKVIRNLVYEKYRLDSVVIPNGVELPEISDSTTFLKEFHLEPGRYLLNVSRLVPEKRHIDLIEAFSLAGLEGWKLVIVGNTEHPDKYSDLVYAKADEVPDVVMTGFQTGLALQELYANAGLFVLPSSHEGLPIAMLEALSYGLPVIASDIPANMEVGLSPEQYFPLGNRQDIARLVQLNADVNYMHRTKGEIRSWVKQRYDWADIARQTLDVYQDVQDC